MLNFDRRILLPDPVLVDNKILPTDIWNEVSIWGAQTRRELSPAGRCPSSCKLIAAPGVVADQKPHPEPISKC